ncbi:50S ribosomal protein L5 [Candidatus Uhrbacteria bacterium]|nr:50S ribosomal protein L5 [Candidatus Uhrbacteria bacterium]
MHRLQTKYNKEILPNLFKKFDYKNPFAAPKLQKVVINIGAGQNLKDAKFAEMLEKNITAISGQKPLKTAAKKSISNFKIREGMIIGMKVTLRDRRMFDFLDKLVNVTLPRIRDFRGLPPTCMDKQGNLTIGFKDQIPFSEIAAEGTEKLHGIEVTIVSKARNKEEAFELYKLLGFPFRTK